jgi:hypothetical protein
MNSFLTFYIVLLHALVAGQFVTIFSEQKKPVSREQIAEQLRADVEYCRSINDAISEFLLSK